jgi:hypothetical protein
MHRGDISHLNVFANLHDVTLQRLDVYQSHKTPVFYDSRFFAPTVDLWNVVPVIYGDVAPGKPAKHPRFEDVVNATLPPEYRVVGSVSNAHLTGAGEKALMGTVSFSDPEIERMAAAGELSLSTGFSSPESPDDRLKGATKIAGNVIPNHVYVFRRGACPNCFPNDNGAMFHNMQQEPIMDDESKGILTRIADALNRAPEPPQQQYVNVAEYETLKKELAATKEALADLVNVMKTEKEPEKKPEVDQEKENLKKEIEDMKAEQAQAAADAAWGAVKANLPEGWLGEKEAETRKAFETEPATFFGKFAEFKNAQPDEKAAEGDGTAGAGGETPDKDEAEFKNLATEFEKKYGIRVV